MGWSYGTNSEGREIGYAVRAICDWPNCSTEIDRGLSYLCGACNGYFCEEHRIWSEVGSGERCLDCADMETVTEVMES